MLCALKSPIFTLNEEVYSKTGQIDIDNCNYVCIKFIGQIYSVPTGMKESVLSLKTLQGKAFVLKTFQ
jgi:hypothetical protein